MADTTAKETLQTVYALLVECMGIVFRCTIEGRISMDTRSDLQKRLQITIDRLDVS